MWGRPFWAAAGASARRWALASVYPTSTARFALHLGIRCTGQRLGRGLLNRIPGYTDLPEFRSTARQHQKPGEFMKMFSGLELLFEPGTKFSYSNSGYFLLRRDS